MGQDASNYTNFEKPDVSKYGCGLAGFTMDLQCVYETKRAKAVRRRIGSRGLYKAGFARLPDGALLATPCTNVGRSSHVTHVYRSDDEGLSWNFVAEGPPGKEPTLLALAGGGVVLLTEDLSRPQDVFRCWRSTDDGKTWSESEVPGVSRSATTRALYQRVDGTVRLFLSEGSWAWKNKSDLDRSIARIFESTDDGATWERAARIETWKSATPFCSEAAILSLPDGRLLLCPRVPGDFPTRGDNPPDDMPAGLDHDEAWNHMLMMESVDGGRNWSDPWEILERGNVHAHLLHLRDGRMLATYSNYHLPWGVFAAFSSDDGRTFDTDHAVLLSHSLWYWVGWPTSIQLDDDSVITCYAKTAYWDDRAQSDPRDLACEVVRWNVPS